MTEDQNYTPIQPLSELVAEASETTLRVIEQRGSEEQARRIRQTFDSAKPPRANDSRWLLFAAVAMATLAEMTEELMKAQEPKRGGGRPRKNRPEEGDGA